jgi:hypothetical protein
MIAALVTLALAAPAAAKETPDPCRTRRCKARVAHRDCSQRNPRACVWHVIHHQRISGWKRAWMLRVPACESTWNPWATNGPHVGLYQFRVAPPSTWATTPYAARDPFSARWQAFAAAWMLTVGRAPGEWACK